MTRGNLIPNPSFRQGTQYWTPINGASIEISDDTAFYGTESLKVTKAGVNGSGIQSATFPATGGLPYSASAYVAVPITIPATQNANLVLKITWIGLKNIAVGDIVTPTVTPTVGGTIIGSYDYIISESVSPIAALSAATGWFRLSSVFEAPEGAVKAVVSITQLAAGTAGQTFFVDAVLVEQSSFVGGYQDNISQGQENFIVNSALTTAVPDTFGGAQLNADIILNNLVFNTIDENNVVWICTDIDGWWGNAAPEIPAIPRGVEDGDHDVSGRYTSRVLNFTGVFYPPNAQMLSIARDRLVTAINLVRKGGWLRTNEDPTKASYVRLSGKPSIVTVNAKGKTEFSIGLKAADPIKYHWNDAHPEGYTVAELAGSSIIGDVTNIGTADVTTVLEVEGPVASGSTIYNSATDETVTLIQPLRGATQVATVVAKELYNGLATLTTSEAHTLLVGDEVYIAGVGEPFDSAVAPNVVTNVSDSFPYQFSYAVNFPDIFATTSTGTVTLAKNDILRINTYDRSVTFNDSILGHRSRIDTLVDWIKLAPGVNTIQFNDNISPEVVISKNIQNNVATIKTNKAHFFKPGEEVTVSLPENATITKKSIKSNIVKLTTDEPHGFSVGDKINVVSTEKTTITQKAITSNDAILTTLTNGDFAVNDRIEVAMPTTQPLAAKSAFNNVVTLKTTVPHGYSVGDSVTVNLGSIAAIRNKELSANRATLTTTGSHGFAVNDSIDVNLPTSATVVRKSISGTTSGSTVVLETATPHGFSVKDQVVIAMPVTIMPTGTRSISGNPDKLVTINTLGAHKFSVGDRISIDIRVPPTYSVVNRSATDTSCTLGLGGGIHNFAVGERIDVTGVSARYNGAYYITAVTSTSVTYAKAGTPETAIVSTGRVENKTILEGYTGNKIIETIPSATSFTYYNDAQEVPTSSTFFGSGALVSNITNSGLNGVFTISSVPSANQFSYTK